jgi:hypothetical protein
MVRSIDCAGVSNSEACRSHTWSRDKEGANRDDRYVVGYVVQVST